jgi:hypothetical protein
MTWAMVGRNEEGIKAGDAIMNWLMRFRRELMRMWYAPHLPLAISPQVLQCQWLAQSKFGTRQAYALYSQGHTCIA